MSIEMENPKTALEKVDAAANHVAQARLAVMNDDKSHAIKAVDAAGMLLFDALLLVEKMEEVVKLAAAQDTSQICDPAHHELVAKAMDALPC